MEYIDRKFGIKTTKAMEKHIFKLTAIGFNGGEPEIEKLIQ